MDYLSLMCCLSVCKPQCIFTGIIHFPICQHCHYLSGDVCAGDVGAEGPESVRCNITTFWASRAVLMIVFLDKKEPESFCA